MMPSVNWVVAHNFGCFNLRWSAGESPMIYQASTPCRFWPCRAHQIFLTEWCPGFRHRGMTHTFLNESAMCEREGIRPAAYSTWRLCTLLRHDRPMHPLGRSWKTLHAGSVLRMTERYCRMMGYLHFVGLVRTKT